MECDIFYSHDGNRPPPHGDRCHRREIDAGTATQVSILGMSTSLSGVFNLFVCGYLIKLWGARWAFASQTALLGLRVSTQVLGVSVGGRAGELVFQACQAISIIGGPRGYQVREMRERRPSPLSPPSLSSSMSVYLLFKSYIYAGGFFRSYLLTESCLIAARPQHCRERGSSAAR